MRQLGAEIGASAALAYQHFRNKDDLLDAVAAEALVELERGLQRIPTTTDPHQALLAMCHAYLAFASSEPCLYQLALEAPRMEGAAGAFHRIGLTFARETTRIVGDGGIESALMLLAALHGIASISLRTSEQRGKFDWHAIEGGLRVLVHGICSAPSNLQQQAN